MSLAPEPKQRPPSMRAGPFSVRTVSRWPASAIFGPRPRVSGTTIESPYRRMGAGSGSFARRARTASHSARSSPMGEATAHSSSSA